MNSIKIFHGDLLDFNDDDFKKELALRVWLRELGLVENKDWCFHINNTITIMDDEIATACTLKFGI